MKPENEVLVKKTNRKRQERTKSDYLPRVVSGFRPAIFLATSIGSTFARLHQIQNKDHIVS